MLTGFAGKGEVLGREDARTVGAFPSSLLLEVLGH